VPFVALLQSLRTSGRAIRYKSATKPGPKSSAGFSLLSLTHHAEFDCHIPETVPVRKFWYRGAGLHTKTRKYNKTKHLHALLIFAQRVKKN